MKRILVTDSNIKSVIGEINKIFKKVTCGEDVRLNCFNFHVGDYRRKNNRRPKHLLRAAEMTVISPIARFTKNPKGRDFFTVSSTFRDVEYCVIPIVMVGSIVMIDNLSIHIITKPVLVGEGRLSSSFVPFEQKERV